MLIFFPEQAIQDIKRYVLQQFGESYYQHRVYKAKSTAVQEAHEAIRPTQVSVDQPLGLDADQAKLYQLIWRRTLMSQMADARLLRTKMHIGWQQAPKQFNGGLYLAQG